jgi:hypothetical protein
MLRKLLLLAILAFSTTALNAIDIPMPECYPCPPGSNN